jgi:hypothetical protein
VQHTLDDGLRAVLQLNELSSVVFPVLFLCWELLSVGSTVCDR